MLGSAAMTSVAEDPVEALCATILAPLVAVDGGRLTYVGRAGGVIEVNLGGACLGCPGQRYTLESVVLPALRRADPSVTAVRVASLRKRPAG